MKKPDFSINNHSLRILIIYFSIISGLELLAYGIGDFFSVAAAWLWFFTGFFWLGYFIFSVCTTVYSDIKNKKFFILCGFLLLIIVFISFWGRVSFSDINPDAAQQIAAGMESFEKTDLNYTGKAFLGYPQRQYLIAALPAEIFGRNIWTFHAGFAWMFLLGLTVLFMNLRKWLKKKEMPEEYALLPCFALLAFPLVDEYYLNFEQAINPVTLSLLGTGLFLRLIMDTDIIAVTAVSYVGCLMVDSYTPSLATAGLLIVFLCLYAVQIYLGKKEILLSGMPDKKLKKKPSCTACIGCASTILIFFIATYIPGRSDRLYEFREEDSLFKAIFDAVTDFFMEKNVSFLGIFLGAVVLYAVLALTLRLHIRDFLVTLWILGVVFFSDYMIGYTAYEKAWVMQRNMVIIPVLVTCIFIAVAEFIDLHGFVIPESIRVIILLLFMMIGFYNFYQPHRSFDYFRYVQPMKYAISYIEDSLKEYGLNAEDEFNLVIYTDNGLQSNIGDYSRFFFPNANTYYENGNLFDDEIDISKPSFFLFEDNRYEFLECNTTDSESYSDFMKAPVYSKTYYNIRYEYEICWYLKVIAEN